MLTTKPAFSNNKSKDKWKPQNKKSNKIKLVTCPHNVYLWVQFVSQCDKVVRCLYRWNGSCATIFYTRKKKQHHSKTMVTISEHPQNLQITQIPITSSPTFSLEWGKGGNKGKDVGRECRKGKVITYTVLVRCTKLL